MRVGVDTGGTFTDCLVLENGRVKIAKVFSGSSADPESAVRAILDGIRQVTGGTLADSLEIIHGTTFSTNSLIERRGARVALVTTRGFEDLIEIGRQARPKLYDLDVWRDPPLVPRPMRWGLTERTAADGSILASPPNRELVRLRNALKRSGSESIAICLLFSFANSSNERRVLRALGTLGIPISASHEILPEFREYERLSTVTINAFLAPRTGSYLARLAREANKHFRARPARRKHSGVSVYVMESSGGITTAAQAAREPVRTILSGPAGGVCAAAWLMKRLKIPRAISFDMGGTSTDVCLLDGEPRLSRETVLSGLPVAVPVLEVHSAGAGGGSLIRIDAGGALRAGPESAGASPGPVCYGRGGQTPTVTDANLILGRLDARHFLGGTFPLDLNAAEDAFDRFIRSARQNQSGLQASFQNSNELARGVITVANANMQRALRVISVERGHDPRDFALIAFGGAGGLHAADLARSLGINTVIIPPNPGAFSALGALLSDFTRDVSQSVLWSVPFAETTRRSPAFAIFLRTLEARFKQLERTGRAQLRRDGFPAGKIHVSRSLDVRCAGQSYELRVPFSARFCDDFRQLHRQTYRYVHEHRPLEVVNLRLRMTLPTPKPPTHHRKERRSVRELRDAVVDVKKVWFDGRFYQTPVYDRERLGVADRFTGPAVMVEYSGTTVAPPDFRCRIDKDFNLFLTHAR